jgi:hypothetical protein
MVTDGRLGRKLADQKDFSYSVGTQNVRETKFLRRGKTESTYVMLPDTSQTTAVVSAAGVFYNTLAWAGSSRRREKFAPCSGNETCAVEKIGTTLIFLNTISVKTFLNASCTKPAEPHCK